MWPRSLHLPSHPTPTASARYSGYDSVKTVSTPIDNEANWLRLGKPLVRAYKADSDLNPCGLNSKIKATGPKVRQESESTLGGSRTPSRAGLRHSG